MMKLVCVLSSLLQIVQQLKDNAHRLSVESFCTMYRTFVFIPKQVRKTCVLT